MWSDTYMEITYTKSTNEYRTYVVRNGTEIIGRIINSGRGWNAERSAVVRGFGFPNRTAAAEWLWEQAR